MGARACSSASACAGADAVANSNGGRVPVSAGIRQIRFPCVYALASAPLPSTAVTVLLEVIV